MNVQKRLKAGIKAHQKGKTQLAANAFSEVIRAEPENADAWHFMGLLLFHNGEKDRGIAALRRSLEYGPDNPHAHCNLGNMLLESQDTVGAAESYKAALARDPLHAETYRNLGVLLRRTGKLDDAINVLERATELEDTNPEVWHNLGISHMQKEDFEKAADAFEKCVEVGYNPNVSGVWYGRMLAALMRTEAAIAHFERHLEKNPGDIVARHQLAALREEKLDAVPEDYVRAHFDSFSRSFDDVLAGLGYQAPQLVADAVKKWAGDRGPRGEVVDLGCGTGLCGPLVREHCAKLIGVDLSPRMLMRAADTGAYEELHEEELVRFLAGRRPGSVDLAISADTLNYIGDLAPLMAGLVRALAPGAALVATFEDAGEETPARGYQLRSHGRFCHSRDYLMQVIGEAGLSVVAERHDTLRREAGADVGGLILTVERPY